MLSNAWLGMFQLDLWGNQNVLYKTKPEWKDKFVQPTCIVKQHIFFSHYFKNFILSPSNIRNETYWQNETCDSTLSMFRQVGRHAGKELTYWLTNVEFNSAHVHVLINCAEDK